MNSDSSRVVVIGVVIAALVGGGLWWWKTHQQKVAPVAAGPAPVATAPAVKPMAPPAPAAPPTPAAPAVRHPIAKAGGAEGLPGLDQADGFVRNLLLELLGRHAVQTFLVNEGVLRKVVATVDNLGRDHAPTLMWPVIPTPGRFAAQAGAGGSVISAANRERYAPFISVATSVDATRVVAIYRRLYPLLQQAYEDLGYPGKYFNDRVVDVIDDLRATPDLPEPLRVKPVEVPGAPPGKTGGLYLFEDPSIESRSAGQKVLLRMGRANAARVKAKLGEIRKLIATDFSAGLPGGK